MRVKCSSSRDHLESEAHPVKGKGRENEVKKGLGGATTLRKPSLGKYYYVKHGLSLENVVWGACVWLH